jgi:ATP-dependent DNA helicase RecQ
MNRAYSEQINLMPDAIQVLKCLLLLDRPYGASYLARLLRGDSRFEVRKLYHKELEIFGSLEDLSSFRIEDLIYYLMEQGLIQVDNATFGTLTISQAGKDYLEAPKDLWAKRKSVFTGWWGYALKQVLRGLRKDAAGKLGKQPYELFSNHALQLMVRQLPNTKVALLAIPGLSELDEVLTEQLLNEIAEISGKKAIDAERGIFTRAYSPSHRKVKEMYESGFSLSEIATRRELKETTVQSYLETLHEAGMLDLKPWIEEKLEAKALYKGTEYFRSVEDSRLKPAHEVLGLDYDTLRLCRLYVQQVGEPMMRYAS